MEEPELDVLDIFPEMWNDAGWDFSGYDAQDWYGGDDVGMNLWDALRDDNPNANLVEPSSSTTFHTASSPPPRVSPDPPRRHPPSLQVNNTSRQERPRRPMGATSSTPALTHQPTVRSPRAAYTQRRAEANQRRGQTSVHRAVPAREFTPATRHLTEELIARANPTPPSPSTDESESTEFDDAIDIDDFLTNVSSDSEVENMPPRTRNRRTGEGVVDLTIDSSPPSETSRSRNRKRPAQHSTREQSNKRRKPALDEGEIEELDLTNEAPDAEEELTAALVAQQTSTSNPSNPSGPLRIGQRQCIICMENFTNITITSCGHVYCHECLTQALLAGEKNSESGKANCPVCRKALDRRKKHNVIPLAFMKKGTFKGKAVRRGVGVYG